MRDTGTLLAGGLLAMALAFAGGCSIPDSRGGIGLQCEKNSGCAAPLVCRLGYCRSECVSSEDCLAPAQCLHDAQGRGVCQVPEERTCALATDCNDPLVCRFRQCVNECETERDCPPGQRCREGGACIDDVRGRCTFDRECPGDLICSRDGLCREACFDDRDCRDNDACSGTGADYFACTMGVRESFCRDPDGDGFGACFFRCGAPADCETPDDPADYPYACLPGEEATEMLCRPVCDADPDCINGLGDGWRCDEAVGACIPDIPDPLTEDAGSGDGGTDGGVVDGSRDDGSTGDGSVLDGGADAGSFGCGGSALTGVTDLVVGSTHACAVRGASAEVLCWGDHGPLTLTPGASLTSPCPTPVPALAGLTITHIDSGGGNTCAIVTGGAVICWGNNNSGQLGRGMTSSREGPAQVPVIPSAVGVMNTGSTACAWDASDNAWCWGNNLWGNLGGGPCTRCTAFVPGMAGGDFPTPQAVTVTPSIRDLSGGGATCGLVGTGGDVFCWGPAPVDQFGIGPNPFPLSGIARVETGSGLIGGGYGCVVRDADGQLLCWGNNIAGHLGDSTTTSRLTPAPVNLPPGRVIDLAFSAHACAVIDDDGSGTGSVWCWGDSRSGSVRPGEVDGSVPTPVEVIASGATKVRTGAQFTCALVGDQVRCWGRNSMGRHLGHGLAGETSEIVTVASP